MEIEQFLIDEIKKEYPNFDIVSEEFNTNNKITENCFIVDPIDGTINFANNLPLWGIQVACVKNGKTVASVISLPRISEFYIAVAPGAIYEYPSTRNDYIVEVKQQSYLKQDSFDYIKNISSKKYCLYSDEDDNNVEKFTRFLNDTNAEGMYLKYYNHFDGYHRIYKIPELVELINNLL